MVPANKKVEVKPKYMDFKALWEAWKEKKRQEEAAKKTLNAEETMIEKLYQSIFGNKNKQQKPQQYQNNFIKPSNEVPSVQQATYSQQQQANLNNNGLNARGRIGNQQQTSVMHNSNLNYPQYRQDIPDYGLTAYQKKDYTQYYRAARPYYVSGQTKSSLPLPVRPSSRIIGPNKGNSVAPSPKMLAPVAPKRLEMSVISKQSFFKSNPQNYGLNYAARPPQNANRATAQSRTNTPKNKQMELQRLRQIYANKRAQALKAVANNNPRGSARWPAPNSVEEFATNRGIVRIQSVIRPLAKKVPMSLKQLQPSRENRLSQTPYNNPWKVYNQLKSQLSSKRDNYKAADSHAASETNSNTWEGATAPGQKGAGHNYGYGYGYGTGDALKGGGWGQGFGGGGPGVNENGNHHTPDFNNPKMEWGQGQGWGQGGKGVPQQEQYKPAPPSGASLYPKQGRQSQAPVRHLVQNSVNARRQSPSFLPRGPSIMNFEPSLMQLAKKQNINSLYLRGNTPVSSPAYQVKYFMANDAGIAYPADSARSMRNEIISNAVADVLRSIQKKKRKRTTK